jgi:hypothetical protein
MVDDEGLQVRMKDLLRLDDERSRTAASHTYVRGEFLEIGSEGGKTLVLFFLMEAALFLYWIL